MMSDEDRQRDDDRKRFEDWAVRNIGPLAVNLLFNTADQLYPDPHTDRYYRTWAAALSHRDKRVAELVGELAAQDKAINDLEQRLADMTEQYYSLLSTYRNERSF